MNLDVVLIDVLGIDSVLTTFRVLPRDRDNPVVVDRLADIFPDFQDQRSLDFGGIRVYSAERCTIDKMLSKLRSIELDNTSRMLHFEFEHMYIPLGPRKFAHGGIYNLVLPPGWRCTELYVSDPFDHSRPKVEMKKQFRYTVYWDTSCSTQVVEMLMSSGRGSFSFVIKGKATLYSDQIPPGMFVPSSSTADAVSTLTDSRLIDANGREILSAGIAEKVDWLELKPNVMGIGINLNEIIKSIIRRFKQEVSGTNRPLL